MRIGVLCYYSFPEGMAATNRIIAYCKGLKSNGVEADVFIFRPIVGNAKTLMEGDVGGVKYFYAHRRPRHAHKLRKLLYDRPLSLIKTISLMHKAHVVSPFDSVLLSFDDPFLLIFFGLALKIILGVKIGFVADEYPIDIRENGKSKVSFLHRLLFKMAFYTISYRILIHEKLRNYFNDEFGMKTSYVMGSIVDEERFAVDTENPSIQNNLCYFGGMDLNNDNVDLIINAFNIIKEKYKHINLFLYGSPKSEDERFLIDMINSLNLKNRVFLKGRISYNEVPLMMRRSAVLVTSQSNTKRAEGGLPTKLAEYLMAGKPAVVSNVSIISDILSDRENIYIVEPDNVQAYAQTLDEILSNYDTALKVAHKGKLFATQYYGNVHVCRLLKEFLSSQIKL